MQDRARNRLIVAIDGPAGSGKSTVAREVAARLGATLLDTGAIYRTLALAAQRAGTSWSDGDGLAQLAAGLPLSFVRNGARNRVFLGEEEVSALIRTPEIARGASEVSRQPAVRGALLAMQRQVACDHDVVAEGRDMGTVVFPEAQVKIFLVASERERAVRRHRELIAAGYETSLEEVEADQRARDLADATRAVAPLVAAADAVILDTSALSFAQVVATVLARCRPYREDLAQVDG